MAEETKAQDNPQSERKSNRLKTALILAGVLLLEGTVITAAFVLSGGPSGAEASATVEADLAAMAEQPVEVFVLEGRFQNAQRGPTYLYDTELFIKIRHKHKAYVESALETKKAQIHSDVWKIISRAEPSHLLEPTLSTISRQIKAALDERLGLDEDGESYVEEVLITKFTQFRADF